MPRRKASPYGSGSVNPNSYGSGRVSSNAFGSGRVNADNFGAGRGVRGDRGPSLDLTIGGRSDRYAGYVRLGNSRSEADLRGVLYYRGDRHHRRPRCYYGGSRYFRHYRPIRHYGCAYYEPWYGYSYATTYFRAPYVHRVYDTDVYHVDHTYLQGDVYDIAAPTVGAVPSEIATIEGPAPPEITYAPLTEPHEATLVGQGNAAFLAGRYDEARRLYVSAILADERDGYAKFLYSLANFALGDYEVAGMAIRRALLTTADLIDYPVDVRSLYPQELMFETQLEALKGFVDAHPLDRGALLLLGYLHYAAGQPERAIPALDRLIAIDADDNVAALLRDGALRVEKEKLPGI